MSQSVSELLGYVTGATPKRRPAPTPAPAPAPGAPTPRAAASDALTLTLAGAPIQKLLAGHEPPIAEWAGLGRQLAALAPTELLVLNNRLASRGATLSLVDGGRLVLYRTADVSVAIDPARGRVRRAEGTRVELWEGARRGATMVALDGRVTITRGRQVQVWHGASGQGSENGRLLTIPAAPAVPGEGPRGEAGIPPRNQFRLPRYRDDQDPAEYVAMVDAAVVRAGGQIVVPADAATPDADWSNCFSYALTQGAGDLGDPFARNQMPRWLQSPMFQLATHGWARVADAQRVHPGDVVLYRDAQGAPAHAGIVREVDAQGLPTVVESKFGAWGVYRHRPQDVHPAYGTPAEFFRKP